MFFLFDISCIVREGERERERERERGRERERERTEKHHDLLNMFSILTRTI